MRKQAVDFTLTLTVILFLRLITGFINSVFGGIFVIRREVGGDVGLALVVIVLILVGHDWFVLD